MCGIVGFVLKGRAQQWAEPLRRAVYALRHRGPDDEGTLTWSLPNGSAGLGHRRLSIRDLSAAGHQPMITDDGRFAIVYNGEIYNAEELRAELESGGCRFRSHTDTEVILHGFAEYGPQVVERLNGMFAFAMWDSVERRLWLVRDRVGIKPLLYRRTGDGIVFGSELRVLADWPGTERAIDAVALHQYLMFGYALTPRTMLREVRKLPPGCCLCYDAGQNTLREHRYWDLAETFLAGSALEGTASPEDQLWSRLGDAVGRRRVADVPLGSFLSGGVDSASVSALLAERSDWRQTFCADFAETSYSEAREAAAAAASIGVDHNTHTLAAPRPEIMQRLVRDADEPTADSSFVPYHALSRFAREKVTVALSGDGADEMLAGYITYQANRYHRYVRTLPRPVRQWMSQSLGAAIKPGATKVGVAFKARQFLCAADDDARRAHAMWRCLWRPGDIGEMLTGDVLIELQRNGSDPVADVTNYFDRVTELPFLQQALYADMSTWLVDDILHKVDRASMAHSLEVRVPFLDHGLVEWCAPLPEHFKLRGRTGKWLLRAAARRHCSNLVFQSRKQGFNAPVGHWINGSLRPWADDLLADAPNICGPWLRPDGVLSRQLAEHRSGRADHGFKLWDLLWLIEWCRQVGASL